MSALLDTALEERIFDAIRTVQDPEIPVNLVDLGLIYELRIDEMGIVHIAMTLTSPGCPVAGQLPQQVQQAVAMVPGVTAVVVALVWEPPWTDERMTDAAKLELGLL
ncbi:iron-sulfur cluster assembly protein [Acidocella sp.]|uniref:iron-sulfur cluster assembly protein n=1 Tax=Acidocella sp. TaxID=50710 RepID=UPI003CFEC609